MGISKLLKPLFISIFVTLLSSGCSKIGETFGIDIPDDNVIDDSLNEALYYPVRDQMCDWGFRSSGCKEEVFESETNSSTENNESEDNEPTNEECDVGYILENNVCIPLIQGEKLKDVESKWYDILTEVQQTSIRKDKNNIFPDSTDLTILTLLDFVPEDGLKMLQNTKVVLPYYVFNEAVDVQLAYVKSSDVDTISPNIIDSSNGAFKVIDSNSILFLELESKGEVGNSSSISLKVQQEDATKYDIEDLNVTIVDANESYNPVSLFFTYNTIIIEENDSRDIYFGISYTIDSNVTVVVRSDLEKILSSDENTTLDLQNMSEDNSVVSAFVSNTNGVPFYFKLEAKGKAGDTMELFLVAKDSKGKYDFKKFKVQIVGIGEADYPDVPNKDDSDSPRVGLTGNDFNKLSATQQALVTGDNNNYEPASTERPVITIFNPETTLKMPKGSSLTTSFYVKDLGEDEIHTSVYDHISKVTGNMESYGKFTITHSNKLFFLTLEAVGEVGDIVPIIIYSQNANDSSLFDRESFNVEIIAEDSEGSYIEPLIYIGFNKLYIEEGGYRTGLQFSVVHSEDITPEIVVADENVAQFLELISSEPPKFSLKATGKSGDTTTLAIRAFDGTTTDERVIDIIIIPLGDLSKYIADESENGGVTNPPVDNTPETPNCETGQHIENNICVDDAPLTCETGSHLEGGKCVSDSDGEQTTPICGIGTHLQNNICVDDIIDIQCQSGYYLEGTKCISESGGNPISPNCQDGYHLDNNKCITDITSPVCEDNYSLLNGECIPDSGGDPITPICTDGYHLVDGECLTNVNDPTCTDGFNLFEGECIPESGGDPISPICDTGFHLDEDKCVADNTDPICDTGFHLENNECVSNSGTADPLPPICEIGYSLKDGSCKIDLVCELKFHIENNICVADIPICETGFHLDENICVIDIVLDCESGTHEEGGACVSDDARDLTGVPYTDWTDNEKNLESMKICNLKIVETGMVVIIADSVRAEGFSNASGSMILHTNKVPIVNGINQNVSMKLIYKDIYLALASYKMLNSTYKVPQFRIDYGIEYSGKDFYVIDESNGKCYQNTFLTENAIPFGLLEVVQPE